MAVAFTLYKGFLIVEYSETDVRAYRSREYYAGNITSYNRSSQVLINEAINDAIDQGDFTEEEYYDVMRLLGRGESGPRYGVATPDKVREIAVHMRDDPDVVAEAMYRYGMITEEEKAGFSQCIRTIGTDWLTAH